MNIYKQASVFTFSNPSAVESLVKAKVDNIKKRGKTDLQEIAAYLSSMSDIYDAATNRYEEDPEQDPSKLVKSAINEVVGGYFSKDFTQFIEAIGFENFLNAAPDFSPIANKIREIAANHFGPGAQQFLDQQTSEEDAEEVLDRSDDESEPSATPDAEVLFRQVEAESSIESKVNIVFNFSMQEKLAYMDFLIGHDFCSSQVMTILYNNFVSMVEEYEVKKSPGLAFDIKDSISEILNRFYDLRDNKENDEVDEGHDDAEVVTDPKPSARKKVKKDSEEDIIPEEEEEESEEDRKKSQEEKNRIRQLVSSINPLTITSDYIDFSPLDQTPPKPPVLDMGRLNQAYSESVSKIDQLFRSAKEAAFYSAPLNRIGQQLNDLLYSIKLADIRMYQQLKERSRVVSIIPNNISNEERAFYVELRNAFEKMKKDFIDNCPSAKFRAGASLYSSNVDIFNASNINVKHKIFGIALKIGAPQTLKFIQPVDGDGLYLLKNYPDDRVVESVFVDIQERTKTIVEGRFNKQIEKFFDLERDTGLENFIENVSLYFPSVIKTTLSDLYPKKRDAEYRPCPVCFKWVPWGFGSETRVAKDTMGFTGFIYSSFREDPDGNISAITEEELSQPGVKWKVIPSKKFRSKDEKKFIESLEESDKRTGGKTWDEIQALLRNSDYLSQREGWHRRASVYAALGGKQLSTVDRRIRELSFQCPFTPVSNTDKRKGTSGKRMSDAQKEFLDQQKTMRRSLPTFQGGSEAPTSIPTSYCGATISPKKSQHLSGRIAFQPQWNGIVHSTNDTDLASSNFINPDQWENQEDLDAAANQLRGGYKFSTLTFACTCRIQTPDYTAAVLHGNFVISQSGHAGSGSFVPPTKPDGQLDNDLAPGTSTFMVCAAPTSISSFDRSDENKSTFILTYLVSTKRSSPKDYFNFINYLILNGMDPQDMSTLNADVDKYIAQEGSGVIKESAKTRSAMLKISKIVTAAKNLNSPSALSGFDPKKMLDGLYLVCPFGHRFNVGHSLRFGNSYSAVYRYSKKDVVSKFPELVNLQGLENSQALIRSGYLVEASKMGAYDNKVYYEEWSKLPEDKRIVFPEGNDFDKALLIFRIPADDLNVTKDYVFSEKIPGGSNAAWSGSTSFDTKKVERTHLPYQRVEEAQRYDKEGKAIDVGESPQEEDIEFETADIPEGYQLPGTEALERLDLEKIIKNKDKRLTRVLNNKINSLGETIKKCLAVIDSYTRGMVSRAMLNAMMIDISDVPFENIVTPDLVSKIALAISGGIGDESFLIIPTEYDEDVSNPTAERARVCGIVARDIANNLRPRIEKLNTYIKDNIFTISVQDFDRELSVRILSGAVLEAISNNSEIAIPNEDALDGRDPEEVLSEAIVESTRDVISVITKQSWLKAKESAEEKYTYGARVVYVAYAVKMANVLSTLYNKYCLPENRATYIGYDIGLDLSNPDEILGAERDGVWVGGLSSPILIDGIVTSINRLINKDVELPRLTASVPNGFNHYINRMDRFFFQLRFTLESIGNEILTPSNLASAKEYIVNRLEKIAPQARDIISVIESNMPTKTVRMTYDENAPETSLRNFHKKRIPYVSKNPVFFDSLIANKRWRVRPTSSSISGAESRVFETQEEAEAYFQSLPEELKPLKEQVKKKNGLVVEEITRQGYVIEEDFFYTSSAPRYGVTKIAKVTSFSTLKPADYKRMVSVQEGGFSLKLEGSVYYLIEVSGVNPGFTLSCKDAAGNAIPIPYDKNLLEMVPVMNTYIAKIIMPEELHDVVIDSNSNFIINGAVTNSNFDSSRLQVGRIKPANSTLTRWYTTEDQWALTQFGNGDPRRKEEPTEGFSDCWTFNGIMLPFDNKDHKSAKGSFSSAGRVFVTNSRFIINFDGEDLDISPLMIRGRSKEEVASLGRLESELASQEELCDYDIREFIKDNPGNTDAITRYSQSRKAQRNKRIRELRSTIQTQFQIKLNTGACYTKPTAQKNTKGLLDAEAAEYALAPQLVNPFRAFQIINNPKLVGATISPEDQERLKDFVVRVYNLKPVINALEVASHKDRSLLLPDDTGSPSFNWEDIFREASTDVEKDVFAKRAAIINKILLEEAWQNSPGEYFDVVPGSEDGRAGSQFQFIYALSSRTEQTRAGVIKHPDVLSLINAGEQSEKFSLLGSGFGQLRDTVKSKIIKYIVGEEESESEASDNQNYADDTYYREKGETSSDAPGSIMDAGGRHQLFSGVGHLGMKFDDVELD